MTKRLPYPLVIRALSLVWLALAVSHLMEQRLRLAVAYIVSAAFFVFVSYAADGRVHRRYIIGVLMMLIAAVLLWAAWDLRSI
ncbi:MAG TPA: hypothetical protein VND22_10230 [Actinomycetota bacterium]|nr:hypothetical protein [Actinomycetota bacterium]